MIRLIAVAGFAIAVATSAQAMTLAPLPQPDAMITQVAVGCGPGRTMVTGVCDGPETFALHGSSEHATQENFLVGHRGGDQRSGAVIISRLIRCTVPTPRPCFLAMAQMPLPAASPALTGSPLAACRSF